MSGELLWRMSFEWQMLCQKSNVAGLKIFRENAKQRAIAVTSIALPKSLVNFA
jgi:hypothetical protein